MTEPRFVTFPFVIENRHDAAADYFGFFPDLPGCVAAGPTVEAVLEDAYAAVTLHLAGMEEDGEVLPLPTPLLAVTVDPDVDVVSIQSVRVPVPGERRTRPLWTA